MLIDVLNTVGEVLDSAYATEGEDTIRPCGPDAPMYWSRAAPSVDLSMEE
jgi:hypothetical protein